MNPPTLLQRFVTSGESDRSAEQPDAAGVPSLLALAAWCGLLGGLLEVAAIVLRKRFLDTNQLLGMSRHFCWLIPLTDMMLVAILALMASPLTLIRPRAGRRLLSRLLAAMALLPMLLAAFPRVYALAWVVLAAGMAMRVVPFLERHGTLTRRVVIVSGPILALTTAGLAVIPWAFARVQERQERARPIPPDRPNILLVVMDTVAAQHLDLYGYSRPTSPAIDELARQGCRFDAAVSTSSWTLPSHASMFTGRWPHELSVGWRTPLDGKPPTVAEYLRDHGYATAGFVANLIYCASDSGLGRGYTVYRDHIFHELSPFKMSSLVQRPLEGLRVAADLWGEWFELRGPQAAVQRVRERFETDRKEAAEVNRELLDWLESRPQPERPFFAFVNYCDAHTPYQLAPTRIHRFGAKPSDESEYRLILDWWTMDKSRLTPQQLAFVTDAYDDCVASIDEQVGRLLDELRRRKLLERTWVILVADHGESFGEHPGVYLHGSSLYRTEVHVPLVVVPPSGTSIAPVASETVSLRDIAATIVELAGMSGDSPFPGESLSRAWRTGSGSPPGPASSHQALAEVVPDEMLGGDASTPPRRWPLGGLTREGWSYIRREGDVHEELYHTAEDRREQNNLAEAVESQSRLEQMRAALSRLTAGPLTPERFNP